MVSSASVQSGSPVARVEHGRDRPWWRISLATWMLALTIGGIYLLPHLVRIAEVGSYAAYSPFSAHTISSMVWDETFLYGAEANYTLTRGGAPAYDDTWEHRDAVYPYSILPTYFEALVARAIGLKTAHLLLSFLFPALSALILMIVFRRAGAGTALGAFLALLVLVGAFSAMTFLLNVRAFFVHSPWAMPLSSLEAGRIPNPAVTFPQFALAVVCLAEAIRQRERRSASIRFAALAGLIGGLLFFSYIYYAMAWSGVVALLSLGALFRKRTIPRSVWLSFLLTALLGTPFLIWKHISQAQGNYFIRAGRLGLYYSHQFDVFAVWQSKVWGTPVLICAALWLWLRRRRIRSGEWDDRGRYADALMLVLLAATVSALAGLNMQVVTGFNLQAMQHFPHMVLQPVLFIMAAILIALVSSDNRWWDIAAKIGLVLLLSGCVLGQVETGRDTAKMHRVPAAEAALFAWLNADTAVSSVVATDDLALSVVLPVRTHNSVLFSNGSRSSASDDELMERFLLASHLSGTPPQEVEDELAAQESAATDVPISTYSYYLFELSPYQQRRSDRHISPQRLPVLMRWYNSMDVGQELRRFRVDYLWMKTGREPLPVAGWKWTPVFVNADGRLWQLSRS